MKHRPYLSGTQALIAQADWPASMGPPGQWSHSLRAHVAMIMAMPTPAIIFWGPDLIQVYNDGYAQIMGPRHPRFFGARYQDCWPDTYPLIHPWMQRVLDEGEVVEVDRERIPVTRYGFEEDAYFTFTFSPLRDDDGEIRGILQPVFEVTEQVLAGRRARLLRRISGLAPARWSWPHALALLAEANEDILGAAVWQVPADGEPALLAATDPAAATDLARRPAQAAVLREVARSGRATGLGEGSALAQPLRPPTPDGVPLVLVVNLNPRLHCNPAYLEFVDSVAMELTSAAQHAQAALAEQRQRQHLRQIFEQAPAGIAVVRGPRHVFEFANPTYRAIVGHRDPTGLAVADAFPELEGQPFLGILDRVFRTGQPYVGLGEEALLVRNEGAAPEAVFLNFVYQPLHSQGSEPDGILVMCYEVTEQVLARRRTEQLAQALRQEHALKDEFLAMLAHELRNPLAPVRSAADLLSLAPGDAANVRRASEVIQRQVRHMSALLDDLLDVSRVTRGLVELDRQPEDLRDILLEAVEQARPLAQAKGHRLVLGLEGAGARVSGDHKRLVQVFSNLLNNAARYTPEHGEIRLTLATQGQQAVVAVSDTGIGIEPALQGRIFDLFVQGRRGAARSEGGLGIGLALVRSLVEMHQGHVHATSAGPGQGSRFEVVLPLIAEPGPDPAQAQAPEALGGGAGEAVLVVDDNVDAAEMIAAQLRASGYRVDVVHRGQDALAACASRDYLACLVDIGLPDIVGTEVAARLRGPRQPLLVAVSGYGQPADIRVAREAGFDHYMVKPVDIAAVLRLLAERRAAAAAGPAP